MTVLTTTKEEMVRLRWWWQDVGGSSQAQIRAQRKESKALPLGVLCLQPWAPLLHSAPAISCSRPPSSPSWGTVSRVRITVFSGLGLSLEDVLGIPTLICPNYIRFCPYSKVCRLTLLQPLSVHLLWSKWDHQRCPCRGLYTNWHVMIFAMLFCFVTDS